MSNLRKIEVQTPGGWGPIDVTQLKPGDVIRIFEPTGEPVIYQNTDVFLVTSLPYKHLGINTFEIVTKEKCDVVDSA